MASTTQEAFHYDAALETDAKRSRLEAGLAAPPRKAIILKGALNAGKDATADVLATEHGFDTRIAFADSLRCVTIDTWTFVGAVAATAIEAALAAILHAHADVKVTWPPLTLELCADRVRKELPLAPLAIEWTDAASARRQSVTQVLLRPDTGLPVTPRGLLQWLGADVARARIGPLVWVRAAIDKVTAKSRRVVFTDGRFMEELIQAPAMLRELGFASVETWEVLNPAEAVGGKGAATAAAAVHVSETATAGFTCDRTIVNDKSLGMGALRDTVAHLVENLDARGTEAATS